MRLAGRRAAHRYGFPYRWCVPPRACPRGRAGASAPGGSKRTDVWAAGNDGTVLHFDGAVWADVSPGLSSNTLYALWGTGVDNVWAAGENGIVLHYDGVEWTNEDTGITTSALWTVWGSSPVDVWAAGNDGTILHYDGESWSDAANGVTASALYALWGSGANDVWAAGNDGTILHYDGTAWTDGSEGGEGRRMMVLADRLSTALANRYRVARELGRGGMATVYLAEDLKHRRKVAIKVLRSSRL